MPLVHLVLALALIEFWLFGFAVARARGRYNVSAPATSGHDIFDRYFRVQMNTLELLVIFVPSILLFGKYISPYLAAALGLVFIVGRLVYFFAYVKEPRSRELGFALSALPVMLLLLGAIFGAIRAILAG